MRALKCLRNIEIIRKKHEMAVASYFQFVAGSDELRAVPKTCSRFNSHAIDRSCNEESNPTHKVVYGSVLFHSERIRYVFKL